MRGNSAKSLVALLVFASVTGWILYRHAIFSFEAVSPAGRDWDFHIQNAWKIHACGVHPERIAAWYRTVGYDSVRWPPLTYLIQSAIWSSGLGGPLSSLYLSNGLWFLVCAFSLWSAGNRISGSRLGGLVACALAAWNPVVALFEMREINLDFPAAAATSLAVAALTRTNDLRLTRPTVLLGLAVVIAIFTKTVTAVFLVPMVFASALVGTFRDPAKWTRFANLLVFAVVVAAGCGFFFVPFAENVAREWSGESVPRADDILTNARDWMRVLFGSWLSIFTYPALIGATVLAWKKDSSSIPWFAGLFFAGAFFLTIVNVFPHYFFPAQPLCAVLAVSGLRRLPPRAARLASISTIAFVLVWLGFVGAANTESDALTDAQTGPAISSLVREFSGDSIDVAEEDIAVIACHTMYSEAIRRGVIGGALALAREDHGWERAFRKTGPRTALYCGEQDPLKKRDAIQRSSVIITVIPEQESDREACCIEAWRFDRELRESRTIAREFFLAAGERVEPMTLGLGVGYRVSVFAEKSRGVVVPTDGPAIPAEP